MKKTLILCWIMAFGVSSLMAAPVQKKAQAVQKGAAEKMDKNELEIVEELSLARTQPKKYVEFLEAHLKLFTDDGDYLEGKVHIRTKEGKAAVTEAIEFLKKVKPLPAMKPSEELAMAADDHVKDTGPKGITGHDGTDKSKPTERIARHGKVKRTSGENIAYGPDKPRAIVMQLIIDDGVKDRGHRKNIFSADFLLAGVATGAHSKYGTMCVMDFADAVQQK